MSREVCLKHRKIRREIFLRVRVDHRTGSGVCIHFLIHSEVAKWQGSGFIRRVSLVRIRLPQPFSNVDHDVRVASRPVKAAVRVRIPLVNPTSPRTWRRDEPSVCKTDPPGASPGCASISPSPVAQPDRASDFESEGWRCKSVRGRQFFGPEA